MNAIPLLQLRVHFTRSQRMINLLARVLHDIVRTAQPSINFCGIVWET